MINDIENYIEYLFSVALQKCNNIDDAQDLTQEVLLSAYAYINNGGKINNMKSWLSSTLNHKYYDLLRKKYKMPLISIDVIPELFNNENDVLNDSEYEMVRQEVAYLSKQYRDVIVKHYLQGKKVQQIADELNIPKGTVLSRLSYGREQLKKGFEQMEKYEKQSYIPERLDVTCNGCPGLNDEPWSLLVHNDMMKQNILIIAYEKPLTCVEIARALGIPTPYIEKAVDDLVNGELMCRVGNRVFTDFLITTPEYLSKASDEQIRFSKKMFSHIWKVIEEGICALKKEKIYSKLSNERAKNILENYFVLHIFTCGIYAATKRFINAEDKFPIRPNGGQWIANGIKYPFDFNFNTYKAKKYFYGGERRIFLENTYNEKTIYFHIYDTQPDLNKYNHGPIEISDEDVCRMLYLIKKGIPFETVGFNQMLLKDIPHLIECGLLYNEKKKFKVAVPVLTKSQYEQMDKIRIEYTLKLADVLEKPLKDLFPKVKVDIPNHLENRISEIRKYSCYSIPMAVILQAIKEQKFLKGVDYPTPPMVLVVDTDNKLPVD